MIPLDIRLALEELAPPGIQDFPLDRLRPGASRGEVLHALFGTVSVRAAHDPHWHRLEDWLLERIRAARTGPALAREAV